MPSCTTTTWWSWGGRCSMSFRPQRNIYRKHRWENTPARMPSVCLAGVFSHLTQCTELDQKTTWQSIIIVYFIANMESIALGYLGTEQKTIFIIPRKFFKDNKTVQFIIFILKHIPNSFHLLIFILFILTISISIHSFYFNKNSSEKHTKGTAAR